MTHKYLVVIEKAGKGYSAYSPDVPGCIATGKTPQATEDAIQDAIAFHLEGLAAHGERAPTPSSRVAFATFKDDAVARKAQKPYQVLRGQGMWVVKREDAGRASKLYRNKALAIKHARELAEKQSRHVVVYNLNGSIHEIGVKESRSGKR